MNYLNEPLKKYLREQIGLEEHLGKIIEEHISEVSKTKYIEARNILIKTREVLKLHYTPLNEMLDKLEGADFNPLNKELDINGTGVSKLGSEDIKSTMSVSRILRDDYSALNLITMSNTLLHTTALALGSNEIAEISLNHLKNLAPLVVQIGKLVHEVATIELHTESPLVDLSVAQTALKNTREVWKNAS